MSGTVAREYLRVSFDASGRERSPEEQHADNQRAAERHGWKLGPAYRDIGSASRYARKTREEYTRLISDLESGRFNASILILWEASRGSRRLSEWVRLIELCEERGIKIFVTSDHKLYDPADPRDRRILQEDGIDSEWEAAKISKRTRRAAQARAREGRPGPGHAPYGYRRVYDPATGRLVGQEPDPVEAPIVREIYQRLKAGHSLRSIARDLTARGIYTRTWTTAKGKVRGGQPFTEATLRTIALNRANIGERVHDPGRKKNSYLTDAAVITPAAWPPIIDRATWSAVYRILTAPDRRTSRSARARHWLARIAVCDECDGPMAARKRHDMTEWIYVCHNATHSAVLYDELNSYAEAVLLGYLSREDVAQQLTAEPVDVDELGAIEAEIARIEADIDALADKLLTGGAAARRLVDRALPKLEAELAAAKARKEELTAPSRLRGLIEPGKDVKRRWKAATLEVRREIAKVVFAPDLLGELRIVKGPMRDPITQRVMWRRAAV